MGHLLVLISTGKNQVDISPYLKPQSSQHHFTWEETNTEYVFKLKPRTSSRMRGCACSGSQVDSSFRHKMLIPEGWEAVVDNVGLYDIFFCNKCFIHSLHGYLPRPPSKIIHTLSSLVFIIHIIIIQIKLS